VAALGDNPAAAEKPQVQAALKAIAVNPANILNRPRDVSFAIDKVLELNKADGPLKGRIDSGKIGVAGHSFGAYTALAVAGERFFLKNGKEVSLGDPRIKAGVVMSPPTHNPEARQFEPIAIPLLLMTGTKDESPLGNGGGGVAERRKIFDLLTGCDRYLLVFEGGDHMVFSGRPRGAALSNLPGTGGDATKDDRFQAFVKASSLQFFDAYLRDNADSKRWLTEGAGAKSDLGSLGAWSAAADAKKPEEPRTK
jgi:predicted dienelactone hydrolase